MLRFKPGGGRPGVKTYTVDESVRRHHRVYAHDVDAGQKREIASASCRGRREP